MAWPTPRFLFPRASQPSALVGVPAGLVAGAAYLLAQSLFSLANGGTGSEPFQRISAILLGPSVVPPPAAWSFSTAGIALLIHLPLSVVYGRLLDVLVLRTREIATAGVLGALFGALLFAVNRLLIAPAVFPWFESSRNIVTASHHVLFGVVAALLCFTLRRYFESKGRL